MFLNNIKIPKNNIVCYCEKKNILIIIGKKTKKKIFLQKTIALNNKTSQIKVTNDILQKNSQNTSQALVASKIKIALIESNYNFYKKLQLIGIGYRINNHVETSNNKAFVIKVGFSHSLYINNSNLAINLCVHKQTKIFLFGDSYFLTTQNAKIIRLIKKPEPYKGKGILYSNEKISLKIGKKV